MTSFETARLAAKALDNKLGTDIKILEIADLTILADYFVIGTGSSTTQVKALAGEVEYLLEKQGRRPARVEGYDSGGWVLLDYENVIVHVFQTSTRDFYSLERLWADAKAVDTKFLSEEV